MKLTLAKVAGFLGHHVSDLNAVTAVLEGVVSALPINAETRHNINASIDRVRDSAKNIAHSLEGLGVLEAAPTLDPEEAIRRMVAEYMAAHPVAGSPAPQKAMEDKTADTAGADQPDNTTNQQQTDQEGRDASSGTAQKREGGAQTTKGNK